MIDIFGKDNVIILSNIPQRLYDLRKGEFKGIIKELKFFNRDMAGDKPFNYE